MHVCGLDVGAVAVYFQAFSLCFLLFLQAVDSRNTFMLYGSIIHYIFQQVGCSVSDVDIVFDKKNPRACPMFKHAYFYSGAPLSGRAVVSMSTLLIYSFELKCSFGAHVH